MNKDKKVLTEIFYVTKSKAYNMQILLSFLNDPDICFNIIKQVYDYKKYAKMTGVIDNKPEALSNKLTKINLKTRAMLNPTKSHIASLAIRENETGIIKIKNVLNNSYGVNNKVKTFAKNVIDYQKYNVNNYLNYL